MKNVAILNTCISGSTGKIAVGLFDALEKEGIRAYFCYGREDGKKRDSYYKIGTTLNKYLHAGIGKFFGLQGCGSIIPTIKLLKYFKKNNIDTIFIVSPHGYYINEKKVYKYISEHKINVVYLMIDEYAYLGNCAYRDNCDNYLCECNECPHREKPFTRRIINSPKLIYAMKKHMYQSIENIVFVGPEYVVKYAQNSPSLKNKRLEILDEAVDTDFYSPRDTTQLRKKLEIKTSQIVFVCIAPFSYERKGCKYFLELARLLENDDRYIFVQVGFDVNSGKMKLPSNYRKIGFIKDQNALAEYYSLGDLFVFPSIMDTMPNACLEALSAGTPLLLFNISGMPYIADNTVATFVEAGDVKAMQKVVFSTNKKNADMIECCRKYALARYDRKKYYSKLINIANSIEVN